MKAQPLLVQAVERALHILDCFTDEQAELSVKDIATALALPKSTVVRLLHTLKAHRFIEQNEQTQQYRLGFKLFELGSLYAQQMDLRKEALPMMQRLQLETGETVSLNILDDYERICIEKVESRQDIRNFVKVGSRSALCFGASGRMLLSYLPQVEQHFVMDKEGLSPVEKQQLNEQITRIVAAGYALSKGERISGLLSIAAPIFDHQGQIIAGLSLSGPLVRTHEKEAYLIEQLLQATSELSARLGYPFSMRALR